VDAGYLGALLSGLAGGFGHCIGMCGPIVASYALHGTAPLFDRLLSTVLYNAGRITTYMLIGAVMGVAGSFVNVAGKIAGFQQIAAVAAGLFMIFMGLGIAGLTGKTALLEGRSGIFMKAASYIMLEKSRWKYFPLGALFGFIPCGLSYSIFIAAAGTGGFLPGMTLSLLFGLGTVPALLLFGAVAAYMGSRMRGLLYKAAGIVVVLMGALYVMRGMKIYAGM